MKAFLFWFLTLIFAPSVFAQSATVTWTTTYQTMDGFGGQTWVYADSLNGSQADMFFSPSAGIGLEYVRTANTVDGSIPDLVTLQAAVARGALVELSLQSPPTSIKSSGSFTDGSTGSTGTCFTGNPSLASNYTTYANYIVNYINTLQGSPNNVPIAVLDVQNEPNINSSSLGACAWSDGSQFDTFVGTYLGPALAAANLHPKVMLGSASDWFDSDFTTACLNDSGCAQYISIAAGHGYGYPFTPTAYSPGTAGGLHLWMSETSDSSSYDASISNALIMAENIHDFLTVANVSGYEWWELAYQSSAGNFGLTDSSFNPAKRFYAEGNWSKYVRPGWVRIDATVSPAPGVYITAFKETSSGSFAIVAINQNSSPVNVDFSLSGFPSVTSVTPALTSASVNLVDQAIANVSSNAFSYSLPATSVVTFHGTASSSSSSPTAPAPPANLTATVH
jgi:glucuronoarabinoxylan endo-1,4-beta-xylanase